MRHTFERSGSSSRERIRSSWVGAPPLDAARSRGWFVVITVGSFHAGTTDNVIPDAARLLATARSFSAESRNQLAELIPALVREIATAHGLSADVQYAAEYPVTVNDAAEAAFAVSTVAEAFEHLYFFQRAARTLMLAYASGQPLSVMSDEIAEKTAAGWRDYGGMAFAHFYALKAGLDKADPSYRD